MADNLRSAFQKRNTGNSVLKDMAEMFGIGDGTVIVDIPIEKLLENKNHPFKIFDDEKLKALAKSIDSDGQLEPIIVRNKPNGFYEILAGHRRTRASKMIGKTTMQAIIADVDDISANKILINSNLPQRDVIYPSELARSYKLRYDDLKRERKQNSDGRNFGTEKKIDEILSDEFNVSKSSVYMHLHFNNLTEQFLELLDDRKIKQKIAEQISYLTFEEQQMLYRIVFDKQLYKLNEKNACLLRAEHESGELEYEDIVNILAPPSVRKKHKYFARGELERYIEKFNTPEDMEKAIIDFLEQY